MQQGDDWGSFGGGQQGASDIWGHSVSTPTTGAIAGDPNGNTVSEGGSVSATVDGPGTNPHEQGDPNPTQSATITVNVNHTNDDKFVNNTGQPFTSSDFGGSETKADTGSSTYPYVISGPVAQEGQPAPPPITLTLTFACSLSATGSNASLFTDLATLNLKAGSFLNVSMGQGGLSATGPNNASLPVTDGNNHVIQPGNGPSQLGQFEQGLPLNKTANVTETIQNVPNGSSVGLNFESDLWTKLDQTQPGQPVVFPVGTSVNHSVFNWSLTISVS